MKKINILYLEDNEMDVELVKTTLDKKKLNYNLIQVSTKEEYSIALEKNKFDIILSDYFMPEFDGMDALKKAKTIVPDVPFIIISGALGEEVAIETLKGGATDYVLKQGLSRLSPAISRAIKEAETNEEKKQAEDRRKKYDFIVNTSKSFMILINRDYTYAAVNDAFCIAHNLPREKIIGKKIADIWGENNFKKIIKKNLDKCFSGIETNFQSWLEISNHDLRCFEIAFFPYSSEGKEIEHVVEISEDITARKQAEEKLKQSYERIEKSLQGIIDALTSTIEIRDPYTAGHQRRVAKLACLIAKQMGFSDDRIEGIRIAALVHDIGKIYVPTEILSKPSVLSEPEFDLIKIHPQAGYDILKSIEFPWPIEEIILQHHEKMDGSGYPNGIIGETIILEARILCVADVLETMSSHRPFRPSRGIKKALNEIIKNRGIFYDPDVVDTCIKLNKEKKIKFLED